jgi:Haem-binding domain
VARSGFRRVASVTGLTVLALLVLIQLVPYGWRHPNPPVVRDAPWPDEESARIAHESCYSCHSNETDWPSYAYVAPTSWLVRYDVDHGRAKFNFSDWDRYQDRADRAIDQVLAGNMPLSRYTLIHPGARLTADERDALATALDTMSRDERDDGSGGSGSGDGSGSDDSARGGGDG